MSLSPGSVGTATISPSGTKAPASCVQYPFNFNVTTEMAVHPGLTKCDPRRPNRCISGKLNLICPRAEPQPDSDMATFGEHSQDHLSGWQRQGRHREQVRHGAPTDRKSVV